MRRTPLLPFALVGGLVLAAGVYCMHELTYHAPPSVMPPNEPSPLVVPKPAKTPLYLFTQENCEPCRRLERSMADPTVATLLKRYEVCVIHWPDTRFATYGVTGTPTLAALDLDGTRFLVGYQTPEQLRLFLGDAPSRRRLRPAPGPRGANAGSEGGPTGPGGARVTCDIPVSLREANIEGRDGAGCCPFASVQMGSRYQNERRAWNFLDDVGNHEDGGGWPEKMTEMIRKYAPGIDWRQYEGNDPAFLERALQTGRPVAITYSGRDCHYAGRIYHMVTLVYLDRASNLACILDNNFIGEQQLVWMSYADLLARWREGGGWARPTHQNSAKLFAVC